MKKDKIIRDNQEVIQFVRLTTTTFFDERLTDSACRLLIAMLNNADDWNVNVTYYGNKLGWSPGKTAGAKKNLMKFGYLTEETEMTSKGKIYHYTILESPINKEMNLHPVSEVRKPNLENRSLETEVRKVDANKSNADKSNPDKTNSEKNKEIIISDSVSVSNQNLTPAQNVETKDTHTPLQEVYFFEYGVRPNEEKIIAYAEQKGYSREVGCDIFLELHNKDFKNKSGTPIKGIQKYIDLMLSDRSKHSHSASIESFIESVTPVNEVFIKNSINVNASVDWQTSKLYAKEASIEFWNSVSKDKNDYIRYMMKFVESNGYKSMAQFKKYIFNHRNRQVQSTGTTYF